MWNVENIKLTSLQFDVFAHAQGRSTMNCVQG